jgi:hypothetical protein
MQCNINRSTSSATCRLTTSPAYLHISDDLSDPEKFGAERAKT